MKTLDALDYIGKLARKPDAHKGNTGKALLIGGAPTMAGALILAGKSALHSGAGLTLLMMLDPRSLGVVTDQPELMMHDANQQQPDEALSIIKPTIIAIGPGIDSLSSSIVSLVLLLGGMILLIQAQQRNRRAQLAINRDSLTELPNRVIFVEELQEAMVNARQSKTVVAVAFIDIDFFKGTNDTYGHETGDLLLIEIAKRIKQCLRDTDFVGRIGGDEFVVLIQNISNIDAARHLCEKIRLAINQPFYADDKILLTAVSIGLAVYPDHGEDEAKLLGKADRAMYMAKKAGRNRVVVSVLPSV